MNTEITQQTLDCLTAQAKASPRLRMNLDLRDSQVDGSQRMLNAIEPGAQIPIHRHKKSSETVVCLRGRIVEEFYDDEGGVSASFELTPGGTMLNVPMGQWHTVRSLESGTVLLEMKDGVYEQLAVEDIHPSDKSAWKPDTNNVEPSGKRSRIYLCLAHMSEAGLEQRYIQEAFRSNWVVPLGPNVDGFEKDLELFINWVPGQAWSRVDSGAAMGMDKRIVALSSGTAAVHLALIACGVGPGDEVLVQSFTFCASAHPVTYLGATPVFVDSEPDTWNMDPALLEQAIQDRIAKTGKTPKAIIPVALYGMPYKIDRILEIANRYGIPVIEDAAEGFGSRYNDQVLGSFGKYGVLSFNGNKMITTSGGGALVVENEAAWREIMMYATQYRESYPYYQHEKIGYNYRMSNICAGIGRGQMTIVNDHLAHHKHVQKLYEELLKGVDGVTVHSQPATGEYDSNYWLCSITLDPSLRVKGQDEAYKTIVREAIGGAAGVIHTASSAVTDCQPNDNVEAMRVFLDAAGIDARPVWKPMHKQPVYKDAPAYVNGVSEAVFKTGMCLPAGPYVSDEDVKYIVETIKSAIEA